MPLASVNGLEMYYEIEGEGPPLLLLHGGLTTIEHSFGKMRPQLAKRWTTIAVEQQGHGRTADIDRAITYEYMADDTAALLRHLKIGQADVFGWSDGGNTGIQLALRHPSLVRKLAVFGSFCAMDALYPEIIAFFARATADDFGPELREAYEKVAPRKEWEKLIDKTKVMTLPPESWAPERLKTIETPLLFITGDEDIVKPEHAVEMFRLLPKGQLAILPGTNHFAPVYKPEILLAMVEQYLAAPMPKAKRAARFG
ncbi:MAG: alpha/beta hydrolase [Rhodospirillaceae bacterium]|nr:alpha/beta hydrolase [Rhodospirillaceae bacterium]